MDRPHDVGRIKTRLCHNDGLLRTTVHLLCRCTITLGAGCALGITGLALLSTLALVHETLPRIVFHIIHYLLLLGAKLVYFHEKTKPEQEKTLFLSKNLEV